MACAHANLILGTNHAQRFLAADFAALDGEFLVAVVELGAHGGHNHFLTGGHIGCAAHNLHRRVAVAQVNCGDVQVVAVGVLHASQHVAHYESTQSATNGLDALQRAHFKAQRRQRLTHLVGSEVGVDVTPQPFVRNIHKLFMSVLVIFRILTHKDTAII